MVRRAERRDVGPVEQAERHGGVAPRAEEVLRLAAEADTENVLIFGRQERSVYARADPQLERSHVYFVADIREQVSDSDQIAVLVVQETAAHLGRAQLAEIEISHVLPLERVVADI
jgi:hypothetical protein